MTVSKAIAIVSCCALLGTVVGAGIGYLLGTIAPDFFSAIFPRLSEDANLMQVGVGLGIVNGGLVGIGFGALVMGILTWYELRLKQLDL